MIYYGYIIEFKGRAGWKQSEKIEDFCEKSGVDLITGYSITSYEPEMAVVGKLVDSRSCLFNPVPLDSVVMIPQELKAKVDEFDMVALKNELNDNDKIYSDNVKIHSDSPSLLMFENDDD